MRFYHAHHAQHILARGGDGAGFRLFAPLYLVILIAYMGYAMTVTIFVPMLLDAGSGFVAHDTSRGVRTLIAGILMALYPTGQFVGSPIVGSLSDRYGRKRVLSISLACSIGFYAVIAFALQIQTLWLLMIACFCAGLCEADVAVAQSSIADRAAPEERGRYFGFIYAFMSLGYIVGPLGGGWLADRFGYAAPFWAVLGLLVVTLVSLRLLFRAAPPTRAGEKTRILREFANLRYVFTDRRIRWLNLSNFLLYFAMFGYFRVITVIMYDAFGLHRQVPIMSYYAYLALLAMIANLFVVGPLARRFSLRRITLVMIGVGAVGYLVTGLPPLQHPLDLLWIFLLASMAPCIALACASAFLSNTVGPAEQGLVMGNNQSLLNGAEAISAAVLPAIAAAGMTTAIGSSLSMYVDAAVMLAALLVLAAARRAKPTTAPADARAT